jgi:SAM-dependent methyltransferase
MTVALGGDGADELFLGYPNFVVQRFSGVMRLVPPGLTLLVERTMDTLPASDAYMNRRFLATQLAQGFGAPPARQSVLWMAPFGPHRMAELWRRSAIPEEAVIKDVFTEIDSRAAEAGNVGPVERLAYQFLTTYLPEDILTKTDRASMFNSLEVRAPFLSRPLAEYACELPTRFKLRGREKKYILKRLACRYLPERIAYRKKHGFAVPIGSLIRTLFQTQCRDVLMSTSNPVAEWFNRSTIEELLSEHSSGRIDHGKKLWALYVLFSVAARTRGNPPLARQPRWRPSDNSDATGSRMSGQARDGLRGSADRFGYEWSAYAEILSEHEEQFRRWTAPVGAEDWRDKEFLDVGCGMGRNSFWPLKYGAAGGVAVDIDERSLESARRNLKCFPQMTVMRASAYDLQFENRFDLAFSIGVIHHLEFPEKALKKIVRAVKPGGRVLIWVYGRENNRWLVYVLDPLRRTLFSRLPIGLTHHLSLYPTVLIWVLLRLRLRPIEYFRLIGTFNFAHLRAIVFDQMLPRIAHYWPRETVARMMEQAGVEDVRLTWVNQMSWSAIGTRPVSAISSREF